MGGELNETRQTATSIHVVLALNNKIQDPTRFTSDEGQTQLVPKEGILLLSSPLFLRNKNLLFVVACRVTLFDLFHQQTHEQE